MITIYEVLKSYHYNYKYPELPLKCFAILNWLRIVAILKSNSLLVAKRFQPIWRVIVSKMQLPVLLLFEPLLLQTRLDRKVYFDFSSVIQQKSRLYLLQLLLMLLLKVNLAKLLLLLGHMDYVRERIIQSHQSLDDQNHQQDQKSDGLHEQRYYRFLTKLLLDSENW